MPRRDLAPLLRPTSIAVVGASRTPGKVGHEVVANLQRSGFEGALHPINPEAEEILGLRCRPDLGAVPGKVDLCLIAVPAERVRAAVAAAVSAGVKAVAVLSAGFKEIGSAALEQEVAALCRGRQVPLMGPNCLGVVNTHHRMNATFSRALPPRGGISLISQSGALAAAILDRAATAGVGIATVISFGNKADLDEIDFLEALARDDATKVIAGFLESIDDGDAFLKAAEEAATSKPVVLMKVGTSNTGARAASTHTGSLVGTEIAYGAAFRRAGVVRAESLETLLDAARAFATQPLPAGKRLAVLTNAGGAGILAADAAEERDLEMPRPTPEVRRDLVSLPPEASVANPVDIGGDADAERFLTAFAALQKCPLFDAVVLIVAPGQETEPTRLATELDRVWTREKPLLTSFLGGDAVAEARRVLLAAGIPDYAMPERAVRASAALATYAAWKRRPPRVVTRFPVNRRRVERILRWHRRMDLARIGEVEAKEILRAYDFRILDGALAESADEAVEIAERIGYPVVLKIVSPDIVHKSDLGGVRLRLADPEQVREAWDLTLLRASRQAPEARVRGAYVEKMGYRGREVVLGMSRDPQFGPMLMFGLGGIFVEVMKDVTFHLAPITGEEALEMLRGTRSYALLEGARGQAPVDLSAVAGGLQRISQLATDYPEIAELDLNPFIVGEVGREAYVADARMTLAPVRSSIPPQGLGRA